MPAKRCPGSLGFVQPKPEMFACPACGREVEIWSDEAMRQCPVCKRPCSGPECNPVWIGANMPRSASGMKNWRNTTA